MEDLADGKEGERQWPGWQNILSASGLPWSVKANVETASLSKKRSTWKDEPSAHWKLPLTVPSDSRVPTAVLTTGWVMESNGRLTPSTTTPCASSTNCAGR